MTPKGRLGGPLSDGTIGSHLSVWATSSKSTWLRTIHWFAASGRALVVVCSRASTTSSLMGMRHPFGSKMFPVALWTPWEKNCLMAFVMIGARVGKDPDGKPTITHVFRLKPPLFWPPVPILLCSSFQQLLPSASSTATQIIQCLNFLKHA